jgi:catechol 2,3-dioxygenase-like lactoylglutathione lyase family enzyme
MIEPKSLNAVVLGVRDLERSCAWYKAKFGFEKLYDDAPNCPGVIIGANGIEICINPLPDPETVTDVDNRHQAGIQLFCLEIDEADLDRVTEEFPEDDDIIVLDDHPRYRSRIVEDPDGHSIELVFNK